MSELVGVVRVAYSAIEDGHVLLVSHPRSLRTVFTQKRGVEAGDTLACGYILVECRQEAKYIFPGVGLGCDLDALPRGAHGFTGGDLRPCKHLSLHLHLREMIHVVESSSCCYWSLG